MENEELSLLWSKNVTCLSFVPLIWWAACHPLGSSTVSDITLGKWKQGFFPAVSPWHFSSSVIINHFFTLKLFSLLCPYWIYSTYTSRSHCLLLPSTHRLPTDLGNFLLLCKSLCFAPFFHDFSTKWDTYLNCCCSRVHGDGEMNATISQLICLSRDRLQTKGRMNRHTGSPQGKCDPQLCLQNPASE